MPAGDDDRTDSYGSSIPPTKRMSSRVDDTVPKTAPYAYSEPKTRLFRGSAESVESAAAIPSEDPMQDPFVGCVVVIDGPGRGASLKLGYGRNSIGRDSGERVSLNFGDEQISRNGHAFLTYDPRSRKFFIQGGTGANLAYIERQGEADPVLVPVELTHGDIIILGSTKVKFWAFCGKEFDWHAVVL